MCFTIFYQENIGHGMLCAFATREIVMLWTFESSGDSLVLDA